MKFQEGKKTYKSIALAISLCALIIWSVLGAGTSLAWFADTSPEINNIFHFANFDLEVSHRLDNGTWKVLESDTKVFDDEALYEPGYVQVVYLKVENKGNVAFDFYTAVSVTDYTLATNVFGQKFNLQDFLKFGVIVEDNEQALLQAVSTRNLTEDIAKMKLNSYSTQVASLQPNKEAYLALVVQMPEQIGNEANYRGDTVPKVELGVIVKADQQKN